MANQQVLSFGAMSSESCFDLDFECTAAHLQSLLAEFDMASALYRQNFFTIMVRAPQLTFPAHSCGFQHVNELQAAEGWNGVFRGVPMALSYAHRFSPDKRVRYDAFGLGFYLCETRRGLAFGDNRVTRARGDIDTWFLGHTGYVIESERCSQWFHATHLESFLRAWGIDRDSVSQNRNQARANARRVREFKHLLLRIHSCVVQALLTYSQLHPNHFRLYEGVLRKQSPEVRKL